MTGETKHNSNRSKKYEKNSENLSNTEKREHYPIPIGFRYSILPCRYCNGSCIYSIRNVLTSMCPSTLAWLPCLEFCQRIHSIFEPFLLLPSLSGNAFWWEWRWSHSVVSIPWHQNRSPPQQQELYLWSVHQLPVNINHNNFNCILVEHKLKWMSYIFKKPFHNENIC